MSPEFKSFTTYLKSIASFNEIDLETAMSLVEIKEIKKGDYFIKEGKVCNHIAFINKGEWCKLVLHYLCFWLCMMEFTFIYGNTNYTPEKRVILSINAYD